MLANHTGVMSVSVRTIVCTPVHPCRDSNSCLLHWHYIDHRHWQYTVGPVWSPRHRQVGEFYQAHLWMLVDIIELSADTNPQFRRGYMADNPHTSRLSLSSNSKVTVMSYQDFDCTGYIIATNKMIFFCEAATFLWRSHHISQDCGHSCSLCTGSSIEYILYPYRRNGFPCRQCGSVEVWWSSG